MTDRFPIVARSVRGEFTENRYFGVGAVVTPEGRTIARVGDAGVGVFLRSAAKPIQALPLLLATDGTTDTSESVVSDRELALICSSHAGSDAHVEGVLELLSRAGLSEEDLRCGVHTPMGKEVAAALREQRRRPSPAHNNCSGNHAGQLLACRALGLSVADYCDPDHPLQRQVRQLLAEFAGLTPDAIEVAVDGCALPAFRMPLEHLALAYARLANASLGARVSDAVVQATTRAIAAMAAHPDMVAGAGRFTTELISATGGRIVGKEGAEGLYCAAVRGPVALGVAVRIASGTDRCRDAVMVELLRQAGCLSQAETDRLARFHRPELHNHTGDRVGEIVADFELIEVESPTELNQPELAAVAHPDEIPRHRSLEEDSSG